MARSRWLHFGTLHVSRRNINHNALIFNRCRAGHTTRVKSRQSAMHTSTAALLRGADGATRHQRCRRGPR
jgi:hypothetical protein